MVHNIPPEEHLEIAEKVRSGQYFRESMGMYDDLIHDLMAERYFYVLVTVLSLLSLAIAMIAVTGLYPLERPTPFIVSSDDITEEVPRMRSLRNDPSDGVDDALMRFNISNYLTLREEYNIERLDRNVRGVKAQSTAEVFAVYQTAIDPSNSDSPIKLYQRHTVKKINVLVVSIMPETQGYTAEVLFEAVLEGKAQIKKSRWQANISFNYTSIELDENTGKVKPPSFVVTNYSSKILQDIQ
jgi:type IV secretory pathway component VirB8